MSIFFEWSPSISVGNQEIDSQHKKLLNQLNKIINIIISGVSHKEVEEAINFFSEYTKEHFAYEEEYMKEINYPDVENHVAKHLDFMQKYLIFKNKFENKSADNNELIIEIEKYIGEWWLKHIGEEDKKYQLFLENRNLK